MPIHKCWAFSENAQQKSKENSKEYSKIKHLRSKEHMEFTTSPQYAHTTFRGKLISEEAKKLTSDEILLIMDSGNLCFGGECRKGNDGTFAGRYNTD